MAYRTNDLIGFVGGKEHADQIIPEASGTFSDKELPALWYKEN
jgi:hypothetical protein